MKNLKIALVGVFFIFVISCKKENTNILPEGAFVDIDGNIYHSVTIGTQVWMVENLKVTKYRNGDPIENVTNYNSWNNLNTGAYCHYFNDNSYATTRGLLYNWYAVNDSRNIAPAGWHVPTDDDWKTLERTLGMSQSDAEIKGWRGLDEGSKLAGKASMWNSGVLVSNASFEKSGFMALSGGFRLPEGSFLGIGDIGAWWSATENDESSAWYRNLVNTSTKILRNNCPKRYGHSVRCLKD